MNRYLTLFGKWWFWALIVLTIVLGWYFRGFIAWNLEQAKYVTKNAQSVEYWESLQAQSAALEDQYKNDSYGGGTPEETLQLFIEALEKKDYTLAANYFVPERRSEYKSNLLKSVKTGGVSMMLNAYSSGTAVSKKIEFNNSYQIRLYEPGDSVPFIFTFSQNPFNKKWLISEL